VLAFDIAVDVVWAGAIPNTVTLGDYIETVTGLRADFVSLSV
jgi:hypothetical protein